MKKDIKNSKNKGEYHNSPPTVEKLLCQQFKIIGNTIPIIQTVDK